MPESTENQPDAAPQGGLPWRELRDPKVLRALSHPVRLRIIEELTVHGPATATELSERIGKSPANLSWHLRRLAQYDFVEEAGGGSGRRRPWKLVLEVTYASDPTADDPPEYAAAFDAGVEVLMGREVEVWRAWQAARREESSEWFEAGFTINPNGIWVTAEELAAFKRELYELIDRHLLANVDRIDRNNRPEGSRPIRFVAWGIPYGPSHAP